MTPISAGLAVLFWFCVAAVFFTYVGYPILIWTLARLFGKRLTRGERTRAELPSVSVLIAAYNEAAVIEDRLENALALDYPREKLDIVVASDGSADGTADLVARYADRGVRLLRFTQRRGKAAAL